MSEHGLDDMYIHELVDDRYEPTGVLALNVTFGDSPHRVHAGVMRATASREGVVKMLRELATHIEYDIASERH